jgi:hypothetical protein
MKVYNFDSLCLWLYDYNRLIDYVKVTNIKKIGFNTLEGSRYIGNVKIITKDGYKNKLLSFYINSSYLDDSLTEITSTVLNEYLNNCLL